MTSTPLRRFVPDSDSAPPSQGPRPLGVVAGPTLRRRGRPPLATREQVLQQIRAIAAAGRLFRVHLETPSLYARARRLWGSWGDALAAAGIDHRATVASARARALAARRSRRTPPKRS